MGFVDRVGRIVALLRAGYPTGMPVTGYVPLLALSPRRLSDDEISSIASELSVHSRRAIDDADVGVAITRVTHEMPLPDDIRRVQGRLPGLPKPRLLNCWVEEQDRRNNQLPSPIRRRGTCGG